MNARLCPLCDGDNRCGMERDPQTGVYDPQGRGCWCRSVEFGAAIALLPVEARGKACICAPCAREAELAARSETRHES